MDWFVSKNGTTVGPMPDADVKRGIDSGHLRPGMQIREARSDGWMAIEDSPFAGNFASTPVAAPSSGNRARTWAVILTICAVGFLAHVYNSYRESVRRQEAEADANRRAKDEAREAEERAAIAAERGRTGVLDLPPIRQLQARSAFIEDLQRKRPEVGVDAVGDNLESFVPASGDRCPYAAMATSERSKGNLRGLGFTEIRCDGMVWPL